MAVRELRCPNGCGVDRFEALNAPLYVDAGGRYLGHDAGQAAYVCTACRGVAIDVAAAAAEMRRREVPPPVALVCPGCATEMLPPEDDPHAPELECPTCGQRFAADEGRPRLHNQMAAWFDPDAPVWDDTERR